MGIKPLQFTEFIIKWLEKSLEKLPEDNHRVKEYVKQYLELWS